MHPAILIMKPLRSHIVNRGNPIVILFIYLFIYLFIHLFIHLLTLLFIHINSVIKANRQLVRKSQFLCVYSNFLYPKI